MITRARTNLRIGPLLDGILRAQRADELATGFPLIGTYAELVVAAARAYSEPLLWPVGDAAERVVGAAVLVGRGSVHARGWSTTMTGRNVLLVATTSTTPLGIIAAAAQARTLGARSVHACGIDIAGIEDIADGTLDSFTSLLDSPAVGSGQPRRIATSSPAAA
jgi:hypothetical protein